MDRYCVWVVDDLRPDLLRITLPISNRLIVEDIADWYKTDGAEFVAVYKLSMN